MCKTKTKFYSPILSFFLTLSYKGPVFVKYFILQQVLTYGVTKESKTKQISTFSFLTK